MLIGFIGTPSSGKTTLAAETFVHLKRMGVVSEFVVEIARQHIAQKRQTLEGNLVLTDEDQKQIMQKQLIAEELMNTPDTICVSDSSPLNSIMYMSDEARQSDEVKRMFIRAAYNYDILAIVEDGHAGFAPDPNRLHGQEHRAALAEQRKKLVEAIKAFTPHIHTVSLGLEGEGSKILSFIAVDKFHQKNQPSVKP